MKTDDPSKKSTVPDGVANGVQAQKLLAVGQLLAGVSHESRNILTAILSFAQVGQRRQNDPAKMAEILKLIESEAKRCIDLHTTVLNHVARDSLPDLSGATRAAQSVSLAEVLSATTRLVVHQMGMKRVSLDACVVSPEIMVPGSPGPLGQVFLNLLLNAMQATPEGGVVRITVVTGADNQIQICVDDSGPGVPADDRDRVFERMFTTKEDGNGIGLAVSHDIVRGVGGSMNVGDSDLGGASFQVTFPLSEMTPEQQS